VPNDLIFAVFHLRERTIGDQPAFVEHYDAIAKAPGASHVMCDDD